MAPRAFVLGTAGHIDHGKTSLVRALTGVDTDRLPEEKRRGITIELGFARWQPSDSLNVAIVDVPGHEALVRTMVAGAGGIDAVLLVIAAEDGVMPQTREHLHVCELLGLRHAVVALTKVDRLRADAGDDFEELLELATEDVREVLAEGPFAEAPILPVSAHTGEGMDELRASLVALATRIPARPRKGTPVLPIDRVFTIKGHGTVITGTLLAGELDLGKDPELELVPAGRARRSLRVRGMQVHGGESDKARAGMRTALNLGNVAVDELARGDVITRGPKLVASDRILAVVEQLGFGTQAWARDTSVQLCAGTANSTAHLVPLTLEDPETRLLLDPDPSGVKPKIGPGQRGLVRIYLDTPLPVWAGQRVILRAYSAAHAQAEGLTVGGGVILDPLPERRAPQRRVELARALLGEDGAARIQALVVDAEQRGLDAATIATRSAVEEPGKALHRLSTTRSNKNAPLLALSGGRWVERGQLELLVRAALEAADRYHQAHPLQPGIGRAELEGSLPGHPAAELARAAVDQAIERGSLRVANRSGSLARPGKGSLDPDDLPEPMQRMVGLYRARGIAPPTLREVGQTLGVDGKRVLELAGLLQRNELLVRVSDDLSYAPEAHAELLGRVRAHLGAHGELDVQALKDMTGLSRKFAVPFLEHLDHLDITRREGDRRLPGPKA